MIPHERGTKHLIGLRSSSNADVVNSETTEGNMNASFK